MKKRSQPKQAPPAPPTESGSSPEPAVVNPWRSLALFLVLLVGMLVLWRLVLLRPLLSISRGAIQVAAKLLIPGAGSQELITVDSSNGDWILHASRLGLEERGITRQLAGAEEAGVRTQPSMLQCFSLSLPIFWALTLAVWPGRELWRILGKGTLWLALVSELSLVVFLAYWIDRYFVVASSPVSDFALQLAGYVTLNVLPYAAPLVVVIWGHRRLQALVFGVFPVQKSTSPAT